MTINNFKAKLKGLPKDVKINTIKGEIMNLQLSGARRPLVGMTPDEMENFKNNPPTKLTEEEKNKIKAAKKAKEEQEKHEYDQRMSKVEEYEALLYEIENNIEAYESETIRPELKPYMYDRDLNWIFNSKNIAAQKNLVLPTFEYFEEGFGKEVFQTIDFFNLLLKQYDELKENLYQPFTVLNNLKAIPLTDKERHVLLGFILKWFGGYPVNNENIQYNTVLKLIEKEFLKFPEQSPEKEFCAINPNDQKKFRELAANLSAQMPGFKITTPYDHQIATNDTIVGSHYIDKVDFDFEGLPNYVIENGIIKRFEGKKMRLDEEYENWQKELKQYINTIPNEYRIKALTKGVEYSKKVYSYHLENECQTPLKCVLNQSWERRIALANNLLEEINPKPENRPTVEELDSQFTIDEKVLTKIDFIRILNVLVESRAFKKANGQYPFKKDVIEAFGKLIGKDLKNFQSDINKGLEKSEEANIQIFDFLKSKAIELYKDKNYK